MTIGGLGEGLEAALQSFGSYVVGKANHSLFYSFVNMLDVVGDLVGGPIMAWAYTVRGANQLPAGYCFLLSAVRIMPHSIIKTQLKCGLGLIWLPSRTCLPPCQTDTGITSGKGWCAVSQSLCTTV